MAIKGKQGSGEGLFCRGRWTESTVAGDFCKIQLGEPEAQPGAEEKREWGDGDARAAVVCDEWPW